MAFAESGVERGPHVREAEAQPTLIRGLLCKSLVTRMTAISKATRSKVVTKLQQQGSQGPGWKAGLRIEVRAAGGLHVLALKTAPAQAARGSARESSSN